MGVDRMQYEDDGYCERKSFLFFLRLCNGFLFSGERFPKISSKFILFLIEIYIFVHFRVFMDPDSFFPPYPVFTFFTISPEKKKQGLAMCWSLFLGAGSVVFGYPFSNQRKEYHY